MKNFTLVKRYCEGLVRALSDEKEFKKIFQELNELDQFLSSQERLKNALTTPFLPPYKRKKIAQNVFQVLEFSSKTRKFLDILVENKRLVLLGDILHLLPDKWNEERGIVSFEVTSAVPLTDKEKTKLKAEIERLSSGPVSLRFLQDKSLIGGLALRKGNIIYDMSLRESLNQLKERLSKG